MTMFRKLDFWPLPKAPGGGDPKKCAGACAIHVSNSHTKSGWIKGKKLTPQPPQYPQVPPLGMTQVGQMIIPSDMLYVFHLWDDTQSLV